MTNSTPANNYISCFNTAINISCIYHTNTILFGGKELSELISPGPFHELKTKTKYPCMFTNTVSAPSVYELPPYIIPDKLIEILRKDLSSALLFIHTWITENRAEYILDAQYNTYCEFFDTTLSSIISMEKDYDIRSIACDLKMSIANIKQYLGPYRGNLREHVFTTSDVLLVIMLILCACII